MRGDDLTRLSAVLLATTCLPMMANAQTSAANPEQARTEGSVAHPSETDTSMEVIVTARRRAENAQKIPGSLSVVGGALLDRSYTVNTQQLSQLVPALNYSSANPRNTAFTIRGLGSSVVAVS